MWEKDELRVEAADARGLLHVPLEQHLCGAGERRGPPLQPFRCHFVTTSAAISEGQSWHPPRALPVVAVPVTRA